MPLRPTPPRGTKTVLVPGTRQRGLVETIAPVAGQRGFSRNIDPATVIPPPVDLAAYAGDGQVALWWQPSPWNSADIIGYVVFRDGREIVQTPDTWWTDYGRTDGTTYSYTVQAFYASGRLSARATAVTATPEPWS